MREAVIHEWCDYCWKKSKTRVEAVGSEVLRVGKRKARRVAWCGDHSIAEFLELVESVGVVEPDDAAPAAPDGHGEFVCKCGRPFQSENRLNAHIGQGNRHQSGKHGHKKG